MVDRVSELGRAWPPMDERSTTFWRATSPPLLEFRGTTSVAHLQRGGRDVTDGTVLMAAYTNYRRDPRVKREAEALVEAGHEVVFLASRQPGEPNRETIAGVDVIKMLGTEEPPHVDRSCTCSTTRIFFVMIIAAPAAAPVPLPARPHQQHAGLPRVRGVAAAPAGTAGDPRRARPDARALSREVRRPDERHWIVRALKLQERWAGRFASAVLTVEERLKDILAGRGIPRHKIHVLMNLPDDRIFRPLPTPPAQGDRCAVRARLSRHARAPARAGRRDRSGGPRPRCDPPHRATDHRRRRGA